MPAVVGGDAWRDLSIGGKGTSSLLEEEEEEEEEESSDDDEVESGADESEM
jgi:hypothetical protein